MLKFKKLNYITVRAKENDIPEGMWIKCDACGEMLYKEDVIHNHWSVTSVGSISGCIPSGVSSGCRQTYV